jgi:anaerobic selenocysteine-containing dehydrogenase
MAYTPFHKDKKQVDGGRYLNTVTSQSGRCPYTAQGSFKSTSIRLEKLG